MKAPVGLLSDRTVLRQQDGGASPRQVRVCKYRNPLRPLRVQIPPFVTCGDIFPRPGEVIPLRGSFMGAFRQLQRARPSRDLRNHYACLLYTSCGIKFALCELGRPPIWLTGGNRCIRAYRGEPVHLWQGVTHQTLCQSLCAKGSSPLESLRSVYARTQENGKISLYRGCSFIGEYGILGLVQQIRI